MGKTFEQLKASLLDWMAVDIARLSDTAAGDIINIVQREICRKYELRYNELTDSFNTAVGDPDYDLPANWSRPLSIWYTHPTSGEIIFLKGPLDKSEFDALYPDTTVTGDMGHYCVWGNSLLVGPTPDAIIATTRNYYCMLTDLVDDIANIFNQNALTDAAWDVLLFNSLVYCCRFLIEDSRIAVWEPKATQMLKDLVRMDARARSIGRIPQAQEPGTVTPSPFWFAGRCTGYDTPPPLPFKYITNFGVCQELFFMEM